MQKHDIACMVYEVRLWNDEKRNTKNENAFDVNNGQL
jgi:hypothetical protein